MEGYILLLELEVILCGKYISTDQAIHMMKYFTPKGWLRVMAFSSMFSRIKDLQNIYKIMEILEKNEQEECFHRVGYLNIINPLKPERFYHFDLAYPDHREMTKILVVLAIIEVR